MLIDFIRHGEAEVRGLLLGRTDLALSDHGRRQFERQTAGRTWTSVVTSPLRRVREPAEALARLSGLPLRLDANWAEMDFGAWDGRAIAELRADSAIAARLDAFYGSADAPGPPGGEDWVTLNSRVVRALDTLADATDQGPILVATHGGPIRAVLSAACGIPYACTWAFRIDYGTRLTLKIARQEDGRLWGEIIEMVQP